MDISNIKQAYKELPSNFYSQVILSKFKSSKLLIYNEELAELLGLGDLNEQDQLNLFSGDTQQLSTTPVAMNYAGHQFGHFNPTLGDGRAALLGEVHTVNGTFDIQLKGSGRTSYSRNGDGKSALGPVLREYIVSEAMHALGVPTTRSLAAVSTGEPVYRETPLAGGILTRVAASHIRIGTFELYASKGDFESVKTLIQYSCQRHYPHLLNDNLDSKNLAVAFWQEVAQKQAKLVAKWMSLGFIHGVMNTDNMTISGETIDYGPCAFMDLFEHDRFYSYIDKRGRYAYSNQIPIAQWNLARLAECLIAVIDDEQVKAVEFMNEELSHLPKIFNEHWQREMLKKFGLEVMDLNQGETLIKSWLDYLEQEKLDFTLSYLKLEQELMEKGSDLPKTNLYDTFYQNFIQELNYQGISLNSAALKMRQTNPQVIPRNHDIEAVISDGYHGDFERFYRMLSTVTKPFTSSTQEFNQPPRGHEIVANTFCGT
jgi:uncharacterized protein YdiU (UPF0061 family)